jgi:hypothetical protein
VVADQHHRAGRPGRAQAPAAVGEHDPGAAGRRGGAHGVGDRVDAPALVEVGAAEEHQAPVRSPVHDAHRPPVPGHRGSAEPGRSASGIGVRFTDQLGSLGPARAEHDGDVVAVDACAVGESVCRLPSRGLRSGSSGVIRPTLGRDHSSWTRSAARASVGRRRSRRGHRRPRPRRRACRGSARTADPPRRRPPRTARRHTGPFIVSTRTRSLRKVRRSRPSHSSIDASSASLTSYSATKTDGSGRSASTSLDSTTVAIEPSQPSSSPANASRQPGSQPVARNGECGARRAMVCGCMLEARTRRTARAGRLRR